MTSYQLHFFLYIQKDPKVCAAGAALWSVFASRGPETVRRVAGTARRRKAPQAAQARGMRRNGGASYGPLLREGIKAPRSRRKTGVMLETVKKDTRDLGTALAEKSDNAHAGAPL